MNEEIRKEISALWDKINEITKTLSNFSDIQNAQRESDIDYLAMETGVDLDQD